MKKRLKARLPTPESIRNNRWLRWLGPLLHQPRLWHFSRRGIALGLAIGIFFGLLIPVAQIPFAATVAVLVKANLPMAVASTLVTNPVTFGPVYYGAYRLGKVMLGEEAVSDEQAERDLAGVQAASLPADGTVGTLRGWLDRLGDFGKPLALGLAVVASVSGLLVYGLVNGAWALHIRWQRRKRIAARKSSDP